MNFQIKREIIAIHDHKNSVLIKLSGPLFFSFCCSTDIILD